MMTHVYDDEKIILLNPSEEVPSIARSLTTARLLGILEQAEEGDTRDLFALYRDLLCDSQIQSEFGKRKAAVLGDTRNLLPYDKTVVADVRAKDRCWQMVEGQPFFDAMNWLLNATLYPVAVVEKTFEPGPNGYRLQKAVAVPFQLLDFRSGTLRIFDVVDGRVQATSHDPDPERYIVHRGHNLPLPDKWGGPMRALLFWWLMRTMSRQWWANLLERFGTPFLKGQYSDAEGRKILERAFSMATRIGGIAVSKGTQVEVIRASAGDTSGSHEKFIEVCNREISKVIVGQTLSGNVDATGLGSGTADLQGEVRDDLRKSDAMLLAMTLRAQLLAQLCAINGEPGQPPLLVFGSDSVAEIASTIRLIESLEKAGWEPDDDGVAVLSERIGFGLRRRDQAPMPFGPPRAPGAGATPEPASPTVDQSAQVSAAITGDVQQTALNGAQVKALQEILSDVSRRLLSPDAAKDMLAAAFPVLDKDLISRMVDSAARFRPEISLALGLGAQVEDRVAPSQSADLSRAFRGRLAPVAQIVRESTSPIDCADKIRAWALSADLADASYIIEQALAAYVWAGVESAR